MDRKNSDQFFADCEVKLDRISNDISELRQDMKEKYNQIKVQFMFLTIGAGACIGVSLHQLIMAVFFR